MVKAETHSRLLLWIMLGIVGLIILIWMIDLIRCKMKKDGCTVYWWRFNKDSEADECTADDDCDEEQKCKDGTCVDAYRSRYKRRRRKYIVPKVVTAPPPPPEEPPLAPRLMGYLKPFGAPHQRRLI